MNVRRVHIVAENTWYIDVSHEAGEGTEVTLG